MITIKIITGKKPIRRLVIDIMLTDTILLFSNHYECLIFMVISAVNTVSLLVSLMITGTSISPS